MREQPLLTATREKPEYSNEDPAQPKRKKRTEMVLCIRFVLLAIFGVEGCMKKKKIICCQSYSKIKHAHYQKYIAFKLLVYQ